ncbi:amidohydrolase family protein [Patulibacter sp. NPDC049589]|uniref:amidohydrolase family protein n=1 Tax=Patulibacter sp. NPDC049589 TaxID=3154731 RepID=UPI00342A39DD
METARTSAPGITVASPPKSLVIDTDVHNFPMMDEVVAYMPTRWRQYYERYGLRTGAGEQGIVRARWMGSRTDAWSPEGKPPGADPAFMQLQHLDAYDVDIAILNNSMGHSGAYVGGGAPLEYTAALMRAANEWTAERWLDLDSRFCNTTLIPYEDPKLAIAEIERWIGDDRFVQVSVPLRIQRPFGHRKYWDLIEACAHYDLPIAFHPGQGNLGPLTAAGWPSYYYEDHVNFPHALAGHMASLVTEGALDRFPNTKIVFQEGGWSWVAPFAWRFDRAFGQLQDEVPHLTRRPSEYLGDHFWYTTQPWEEMEKKHQFEQAFKAFGHPEKLLFASDYPHWDFDAPDTTAQMIDDPQLREMIMSGNALDLYSRLPKPEAGA